MRRVRKMPIGRIQQGGIVNRLERSKHIEISIKYVLECPYCQKPFWGLQKPGERIRFKVRKQPRQEYRGGIWTDVVKRNNTLTI